MSINYRLNFYGYSNSPALSSKDTNAGLRDQRAAVEWVAANIAAFGGDPTHLILGGQSAGSASVAEYLYAYPLLPLIRGAITMSGQAALANVPAAAPIPGLPTGGANPFPTIASSVGCPLTQNDYAAQLQCVRGKTVSEITSAITTNNILGITPFVDRQTVFSAVEYKLKAVVGDFARVVSADLFRS